MILSLTNDGHVNGHEMHALDGGDGVGAGWRLDTARSAAGTMRPAQVSPCPAATPWLPLSSFHLRPRLRIGLGQATSQSRLGETSGWRAVVDSGLEDIGSSKGDREVVTGYLVNGRRGAGRAGQLAASRLWVAPASNMHDPSGTVRHAVFESGALARGQVTIGGHMWHSRSRGQ